MTLRNLTVVAHRWLGLATSIVVVAAGLSGALLVWPIGRGMASWHTNLGLGRAGALIVLVGTWIAVALIASGLYLWWKSRTLRVRTRAGWRAFVIDLHYSLGALTLLITLLIAATGALRPILPQSQLHHVVTRLHLSAGFPAPIKMVYTIGSIAVAVQGLTGILMWASKQRIFRRRSGGSPAFTR